VARDRRLLNLQKRAHQRLRNSNIALSRAEGYSRENKKENFNAGEISPTLAKEGAPP
jgi:hypothetical protein